MQPNDSHTLAAPERAWWRAWLLPVCVLAPLLLFGLLAKDVTTRDTIRFDAPFLLGLHAHATPFFDTMMLTLSKLGGLPVLGYSLVLIAYFSWRKARAQAAFLSWAMVGTCLLNVALKAAFERARPDLWLSLAPEHDFSFPSGHSMLSCTFVLAALALAWKSPWPAPAKWVATLVGVSFMVGVVASRLYLGVHFPSDVLAGFCLSFAWISLLSGVFQKRLSRSVLVANR